ncbi:hypothetical protein BZL54_08540 [Burkholderia ubonensis subsp. mesacidophila]|uniref:Uncharacterized protein n=1 Tax=Burkholderia ubonensis subsp. mesacidophila TaxID=265293 RepID=A0A2A4FJ47_9BURK|nr:hypothetical protein BZL54_08540 [Burkholderia ubonensis subsp. mesacidophila]
MLLSRIDESIKQEFYLEASWLVYAILEDRLVSALDETGGAVTANGKPIRMLGPKLVALEARRQETLNLRKAFFGDMLSKLDAWKEQRNELMHAMADESKEIPEIDAFAARVAISGRELARDFCSACRRLKKFNSA